MVRMPLNGRMTRLHLAELDPDLSFEDRLGAVVERERLTSRIGLRVGVGQIIIGLVLLVLGATGTAELSSTGARLLTVPAGALFAAAGGVVIWATRPSLLP